MIRDLTILFRYAIMVVLLGTALIINLEILISKIKQMNDPRLISMEMFVSIRMNHGVGVPIHTKRSTETCIILAIYRQKQSNQE